LKFLSNEPYSTSRRFLATGIVWALVGAALGFIAATELVAPDLIGKYRILSFGRLRPTHVNVVAFGFVYSLLLAGAAYIVPRLCRTEGLWSERLGNLGMWLWNLVFITAAATIPFGMTQAREYAELVYPIDVLVVVSVLIFTVNVYMTIWNRKEKLLYVSLWYIAGGLAWTLAVYFIGNVMFRPPEGALTGIVDSVWLWFYGHNVVGLILTPLAVAMIYWVLPRATGAPVWSHTMSLIGFWVLLAMYTHTGTHHLLQAPVPRWLKVISVVDSIALVIPVLTVLLNVWLPMRGRWSRIHYNVGAKFVFAGTIWYLITCFQGPMHSLPSVQRLTHFTHWVVGHAHIAVLGFAGFVAIGTVYSLLPSISGRELYSRRMADLHYWMMLAGLGLMFLSLTIAGLVQGNNWLNGEAFYRVVPQMKIYMILRAISGAAILSGLVLMAANAWLTFRQPVAQTQEETPPASSEGTEVCA
jgi:cbb3-type cytochrome c oxidase subunit I